jgi:hypothetical protein
LQKRFWIWARTGAGVLTLFKASLANVEVSEDAKAVAELYGNAKKAMIEFSRTWLRLKPPF